MSRLDDIEKSLKDCPDLSFHSASAVKEGIGWLCAKLKEAISIIESVNGAELVSFSDGDDMEKFLKSIKE